MKVFELSIVQYEMKVFELSIVRFMLLFYIKYFLSFWSSTEPFLFSYITRYIITTDYISSKPFKYTHVEPSR